MALFFNEILSEQTQQLTLSPIESSHIAKVLRLKLGASISLTNGQGLEWKGTLTIVSPKACKVEVVEIVVHPKPKSMVHLAVAPTKNIQRLEWLLEKATEIGVTHFTPLLCQHAERKVIKVERLQKIMIAALKQSQQFYLPTLAPLTPFQEAVKTVDNPGFIAHCYNSSKTLLSMVNLPQHCTTTHLFIGPEGDFSPEEVQLALDHQLQAVSLGNTRLRTETAGLIGAHSLLLKMKQQN